MNLNDYDENQSEEATDWWTFGFLFTLGVLLGTALGSLLMGVS